MSQEQWMEEFRKGLRWHLETYFAAGNGISGEDALRLATDTIAFQVSELLTTQLEAARREERKQVLAEFNDKWQRAASITTHPGTDHFCTSNDELATILASLTNHN